MKEHRSCKEYKHKMSHTEAATFAKEYISKWTDWKQEYNV